MRGRKPKPTELKVLTGNPGGRDLNLNEPEYSPALPIEAPDSLNRYGKKRWRELINEMSVAGVLKATDIHVLEQFCYWLGVWRDAVDEVKAEGLKIPNTAGNLTKNPSVAIASDAANHVARFGALLGLDPSSRSRIMGVEKKSKNQFEGII